MWTSKSVTAKEERLLWKLESVIDLFKKFQDSADEEDKLTILEALGDIREILTKSHITKPLRRKEIADIEMVLKDLNSHVKAIALDDLFDEVNELKLRMDVVEKRWEVEKTEEFSKTFLYDEDDDEMWSRISAKRKEILGKSSLWLRSRQPRSVYKARFDLRSQVPVRVGTAEEDETEDWQERGDDEKKDYKTYSTDQLLRSRINNLQGFLKERKTRLRGARRRRKDSSGLIASVDLSTINNKKSLQNARNARFGEVILGKTSAVHAAVCQVETTKGEPGSRCDECHRLTKERDKFWGLESDSEEDNIKDFNEHVRRRSLRTDSSITFSKEVAGKSSSSSRLRGFAERHKRTRIAGRGTWATPAYDPPWQARKANRRSHSVHSVPTASDLEKARFGQKKGILGKLFTRLTGNHFSI